MWYSRTRIKKKMLGVARRSQGKLRNVYEISVDLKMLPPICTSFLHVKFNAVSPEEKIVPSIFLDVSYKHQIGWTRNFRTFYETCILLAYIKESQTGSYSKPDESSQHQQSPDYVTFYIYIYVAQMGLLVRYF